MLSLSLAAPSRLLILLPMALLVGFKVALSAKALATCRAGVTASLVCAGHVGLQLLSTVEALLALLAWMCLALRVLLFLMHPELSWCGEKKVTLWARDLASCRRSRLCFFAVRSVFVSFGILRGRFWWPSSPSHCFGFSLSGWWCRRCWRRCGCVLGLLGNFVFAPFLLLLSSRRARFSFGRPAAPLDRTAAIAVLVRCVVFLMAQQLRLLFESPSTFTTAVGFARIVSVVAIRARRVLGQTVSTEKCLAPERLVAFSTQKLTPITHLPPVCGQLGECTEALSAVCTLEGFVFLVVSRLMQR